MSDEQQVEEQQVAQEDSSEKPDLPAVEGLPLLWTVDLGKDNPKRFGVLAAACAAGLIGLNLFNSILLGIVGFLAIILSVAEMFFPLKYRIDEKGVSVRCGISVTALEWSDAKRIVELEDAVRVSPLERPSRLDPFRGVLVRFSGNEKEVRGKIQELTQRHGLSVGHRHDRSGGEGTP